MTIVVNSKRQRIANLNPHYTNERFRKPQTVFLLRGRYPQDGYVPHAEYNYSDRIWQWDWDKCDKAREAVNAKGLDGNTAAWHEAWLRIVLDDSKLNLVHILAGVNLSNGYPYHVYGYIKSKPDENKKDA